MTPGRRASSSSAAAALRDSGTGRRPAVLAAKREMAEIQRARLVAAMVSVAAREGVGKATVARLVSFSGISRRTFYELFEDREQCFLAAFDDGAERVTQLASTAYGQSGAWSARVRAALAALFGFVEDEPGLARLLVVEALGAGPQALGRRRELLERAAIVIDRDGRALGRGKSPSPLTAEGALGGALSVIHARMSDAGEKDGLSEMLSPLVAMIVLPYLGSTAATAELKRRGAGAYTADDGDGRRGDCGGADASGVADPLRALNMRLTYRTVRVLQAVAEHSGASNRQIADQASIRDQGQISKLLARLEHLGLIANEAGRKGERNSWTLTNPGREVSRAFEVGRAG